MIGETCNFFYVLIFLIQILTIQKTPTNLTTKKHEILGTSVGQKQVKSAKKRPMGQKT